MVVNWYPNHKIDGMQFWFARKAEITLREQLVTQAILGVLCGDLLPGQRLPSTREMARRFHLHPNTVSVGYRQLEREKWVETRHGSGVYVRGVTPAFSASTPAELDRLIAHFFRSARKLGVPLLAVRSRLRRWLALQPPNHFLLIEPDDQLRRIVVAEMQRAVTLPVKACGPNEQSLAASLAQAIPVALPSKTASVRELLPARVDLLTLRVRSVQDSLAGWLPAPHTAQVGVVSGWQGFLKSARTMMIAAGFHADQLVLRDVRKPEWRRGLKQMAAIVCDSLTAKLLPTSRRVIVFPLLSDAAVAELRNYEAFVRSPLGTAVRRR